MAELDYNWTPYRYGYNNPIMFTDPDGLWEFKVNGDAKSGYIVSLNWEEGDNLETLSKQTGFSVDEIKSFYNESTIKALEEGSEVQLIKFGGFLEGINDALNEVNTEDCNCWGTALEYGETGKVDPKGGIDSPIDADRRLINNFTQTKSTQTGDVIRYAYKNGYKGLDLNGDGKVDAVDEVILKITNYPSSGRLMGGTSHYATFLLTNDRGTQVFTKNGWKGANGEKVKWEILYEQNVIRFYGLRTGINGGSPTYKKK